MGAVIALEPHKNSDLKSKRGKNTKAGQPHIHMVFWLYNPFLNPSIHFFSLILLNQHVNVKIVELKSSNDFVKTCLYTIKERDAPELTQICQELTSWPSSVNIWVNNIDALSTFQAFLYVVNPSYAWISNECFSQVPTCRKQKDEGLMLAEIFYKIFLKQNLAVANNFVYQKIPFTHFSWKATQPLEQWVANSFNIQGNPEFSRILKENIQWISTQGAVNKKTPTLPVLPALKLHYFLLEFTDCAYYLSKACAQQKNQIDVNTAGVCFINQTFDLVQPPFQTIGFLHRALNFGQNIFDFEPAIVTDLDPKDRGHALSISQAREYKNKSNQTMRQLTNLLFNIGGLFQPHVNRKQNPALYIHGQPSTFKTTLIRIIFEALIGLNHVDVLSRTKSRFNTSVLNKSHADQYVLLFDDFRTDHIGLSVPDLLNLLDGTLVQTEQKFRQSKAAPLRGSVAFTSNKALGYIDPEISDSLDSDDLAALKSRISSHQFFPISPALSKTRIDYLIKLLEREAIAFALFCNAFFIHQSSPNFPIQLPKAFFTKALALPASGDFDPIFLEDGQKHFQAIIHTMFHF